MDLEEQERIKQAVADNGGPDGIVALLGQPDAESAEMFAETISLGDPTYAGALLAHWLDSLAGFYAAAFLLSRLMLPAAVGNR